MMIDIPQDLARQLEQLADAKGATVETLLRSWLESQSPKEPSLTLQDLARNAKKAGINNANYQECQPSAATDSADRGSAREREESCNAKSDECEMQYPPGSLARFAQLAQRAGLSTKEPVDTSARSREILNAEFADFVDRRLRR